MKNIVAVALVLVAAATAAHAADQPAWSEAWGSAEFNQNTIVDTGANIGRQLVNTAQQQAAYTWSVEREIARLQQEITALRLRCGDRCAGTPAAGSR